MNRATAVTTDDSTGFWRDAYRAHGPAVLAFLTSRLGSRDEAEELLQETFVRALRAGSLKDRTRVRAYLFTTAHNLLRNHHRRQGTSPFRVVEDGGDATEPGEGADGRASLHDLVGRLGEVLAGLPEAHRRAFELGILERVPYREIARRTGWSVAAVKVNVYRARRRVIDALEEYRDA